MSRGEISSASTRHSTLDPHRPALLLYFLSMGAPVFLIYMFFTLHSRVLPNWIAPSIVPLFCLAGIYWDERMRASQTKKCAQCVFVVGLVLGLFAVVVLHETNLIGKIAGRPLPAS